MKVFQVIFNYSEHNNKEILEEVNYWTGCWISVAEKAIRHAEEYDKDLVAIRDVLTITQQHKQGLNYYPEDESDRTTEDHNQQQDHRD